MTVDIALFLLATAFIHPFHNSRVSCVAVVEKRQCGRTPIKPDEYRIVGGHPARPYSWPWQAELCIKNSQGGRYLRCGATLIDRQWVMTAGHCVEGYGQRPEKFVLKLGTYDYRDNNEKGEVLMTVASIFLSPRFHKPHPYSHDIALLKMSEAVNYTEHIQAVCLPENVTDLLVEGKTCYVTGWGAVNEGGPVSSKLMQVTVPFLSMRHCEKEYPQQVDDTMLCAGRYGMDSCQGDSGGPLVTKHKNGHWYQAGIVSWGHGCAESGYAGVYGRVSANCEFLSEKTGFKICC